MSKELSKLVEAIIIRAVKTFFQTFVATIGTSAVMISDVNWKMVLSASALAMILSVATSVVGGLPEAKLEHEEL